jgi:hypothetical protein
LFPKTWTFSGCGISHLCDATLGSKVGHFLEDSETDERREITGGMSEYHITHWN